MAVFDTELKQRSPEWHRRRDAKVTGTLMKGVLGGKVAQETAKWDAVASLITVPIEELQEMKPMDRGTFLEPEAITAFEFETGLKTKEVGIVESEENLLFAQSPDSYIENDDGIINEEEAVEVKCLGGGKHIQAIRTNKVPKDYDPQVIGYFTNNPKLNKLYFVLYNPEIPNFKLHIITVTREELATEIAEAMVTINAFETEVYKELSELGITI